MADIAVFACVMVCPLVEACTALEVMASAQHLTFLEMP